MSTTEIPDVVREHASVDRIESEVALSEPGAEGTEVGAVRALRRLGQSAVLEESLDRPIRVHSFMFVTALYAPATARVLARMSDSIEPRRSACRRPRVRAGVD